MFKTMKLDETIIKLVDKRVEAHPLFFQDGTTRLLVLTDETFMLLTYRGQSLVTGVTYKKDEEMSAEECEDRLKKVIQLSTE